MSTPIITLTAGWNRNALNVEVTGKSLNVLSTSAEKYSARIMAMIHIGSFYSWFLSAPVGVPDDLSKFKQAWGNAFASLIDSKSNCNGGSICDISLFTAKNLYGRCAGGITSEAEKIVALLKELGASGPIPSDPLSSIKTNVGIASTFNQSNPPNNVWRSSAVNDVSTVTGLTECDVASAVVLPFIEVTYDKKLTETKRYHARLIAWLDNQARLVKFRVLSVSGKIGKIVTSKDIDTLIRLS